QLAARAAGKATKRFIFRRLRWSIIYVGIGLVLVLVLPFPYDLASVLGFGKRHKCTKCGKKFKDELELANHNCTAHTA
nr:hypothetical protein [Thermoproteota archaeon]